MSREDFIRLAGELFVIVMAIVQSIIEVSDMVHQVKAVLLSGTAEK